MPDDLPLAQRAAMVLLRRDGRWEVQVSDSEGTDGSRRWRHKGLFKTEQEAEIYARSILPYSDTAWDQRFDRYNEEAAASARVARRTRTKRHQEETQTPKGVADGRAEEV